MKLGEIVEKPISGEWGDEDLDGVGVPVLRTTNFTNEGVLNLNSVVTRLIPLEKCEKKYLCPGDIIIEKSGGSDKQPVGRVVFYDGPERQFLFNNFTAALRVKENLDFDKKFLFYALFIAYRRGGTEPYQNKTTGIRNLQLQRYLNELEVPAPPLAEQERIVAELDAVVATLKKRQAQLAELDALVEARFVELFGDPATNPKGWPVKILKDCLAEIQSGNREKGGALASGVPSLGAEHINNDGGFNLQPEKLKYIGEEFYCNLKRGKIQIGDVLLVKDGATTGKTGYVTSSFPFEKAAVNEHVFLLRSKPGMTNLFLFYYLRSKVGKERVLGKFHGATIGGITKDFALIEIPLPPLELQERFAAEVERVEALKTTVRAGIAETQTLFDALTQRYFG